MELTISSGRKAPTVEAAIELHRKWVYYLLNYIYIIILECLNKMSINCLVATAKNCLFSHLRSRHQSSDKQY